MRPLHLLATLLLLSITTASLAQKATTGHQRRQQRHAQRVADRHDPARWDRMPLWSAGFSLSGGYAGGDATLERGVSDYDPGTAWRLEGSRRIRKGWYLMAQLERNTLRGAGLVNAEAVPYAGTTWSLFGGSATYRGDMLTAEHRVNTLALTTGLFNAPFPRRHDVGLTLAMGGGLALHQVNANYGVQHNATCTVSYDWWSGGSNTALDSWHNRQVFNEQHAFGLSLLMQLRVELWLGRHVSILVPSMEVVVPVVQPHFSSATDPGGTCTVEAYDLNLAGLRFGTGLAVHF